VPTLPGKSNRALFVGVDHGQALTAMVPRSFVMPETIPSVGRSGAESRASAGICRSPGHLQEGKERGSWLWSGLPVGSVFRDQGCHIQLGAKLLPAPRLHFPALALITGGLAVALYRAAKPGTKLPARLSGVLPKIEVAVGDTHVLAALEDFIHGVPERGDCVGEAILLPAGLAGSRLSDGAEEPTRSVAARG
jgi:hypothetical protein